MIFLIALSLSMDAFSLATIYGISNYKFNYLWCSIIVGIFHFFMPIMGYLVGNIITNIIPIRISVFVGLILIIIGINIMLEKDEIKKLSNLLEMIFFSLAVSLDSFSIGIGLAVFTSNIIFAPIIFSLTSFLLTYIGFSFGKSIGKKIGSISKVIGSFILIILGVIYLFK